MPAPARRSALLASVVAVLLAVAPAAAAGARANPLDLSRTPMLMPPAACAVDARCAAHVRARDERFARETPEERALEEQRLLTFTPDRAVARAVDRQMRGLFPDEGRPALRPIARALRRFDARAALRRELASRRWSGRDLGDLLALEAVIAWRFVNRERATDPVADQAFRDGLRDFLMRTARRDRRGEGPGQTSDAETQQAGESMALMMLTMERLDRELRSRGIDPAARIVVRGARSINRDFWSIDMARLRQVPTGFARR